jgi:hypothetical protein
MANELTPTQRAAFERIPRWPSAFVESIDYAEVVFLAGYALGAQERQAQDATIVRSVRDLPGNPTTVREMCANAIEQTKLPIL